MTLTQAQDKYIKQVNACIRPNDRKHRVRQSASKRLRSYCERIGMTEPYVTMAVRDAWDMAELERNSED